jgi:hypothetical protein
LEDQITFVQRKHRRGDAGRLLPAGYIDDDSLGLFVCLLKGLLQGAGDILQFFKVRRIAGASTATPWGARRCLKISTA